MSTGGFFKCLMGQRVLISELKYLDDGMFYTNIR